MFEFEGGQRQEYDAGGKYALILEGDQGELDARGVLFWDFRPGAGGVTRRAPHGTSGSKPTQRLSGELELKKKYQLEIWPQYEGKSYPLVAGVPAGSLAERLGVKVNDLVLSYGGRSLSDVSQEDLRAITSAARNGPSATVVEVVFLGREGAATHHISNTDSLGLRLSFPRE